MNVLVIDDDVAVRNSLRYSLEAEGIDVEVADGPEEAVRAITRSEYDAVVTDLAMVGDGEHVLERVHVLRPGTPVIIITGDPSKAKRTSAVRNAYAILSKPFTPEGLIKLLRKATRARRRS